MHVILEWACFTRLCSAHSDTTAVIEAVQVTTAGAISSLVLILDGPDKVLVFIAVCWTIRHVFILLVAQMPCEQVIHVLFSQ
jgi:hypothetical protein